MRELFASVSTLHAKSSKLQWEFAGISMPIEVQADGVALPDFAARRVARFYMERYQKTWGGKFIFKGRKPGKMDVLLQSNDYLAIAGHPTIAEAIVSVCRMSSGAPMMSSLFLQGSDPLHVMEGVLANFLGYEEGVLTQSGFAANVGLLESVIEPDTPVYIDMLAHASLWEGMRSAGAKGIHFPHNDFDRLHKLILRHGIGVILVDSVYSTNGSTCDLELCAAIAKDSGCMLIVDESHSLGTHGAHGEGMVASLGLQDRVHFVTASLAKAYACRAGFIACPASLNLYISMNSNPAIFSSSLMPLDVAAIQAAHRLITAEHWRRERLWRITRHIRSELDALGYPVRIGSEQIVSFEIGTEPEVMHIRDELERAGIFGSIFCPPATGKKRSLIRFSLNAGLSDSQVEHFLDVCKAKRDEFSPAKWSANRYLSVVEDTASNQCDA